MIPSQSLVKGCENIRPKAKGFVSSLLESYDLAEVSSQAGGVRCCVGQEGPWALTLVSLFSFRLVKSSTVKMLLHVQCYTNLAGR